MQFWMAQMIIKYKNNNNEKAYEICIYLKK